MKHIVKRKGHAEAFDDKKLYDSVYFSCIAVHEPVGIAQLVSERVVQDVSGWLVKKSEVTSNDIRRHTAHYLYDYSPDAAFIYLHHRIIY